MCGVIAAAAQVVGGVVQAVGAVKSGYDTRTADNANAAIADTEANATQAQARGVQQQAAIDAGDIQAQGSAAAASQQTMMAGSNVSGGTTTAAEVKSDINAARDEATVKTNAARQAWGLNTQAASQHAQADQLRKQGKAAVIGGWLGGAGALLGSAGKAAGSA